MHWIIQLIGLFIHIYGYAITNQTEMSMIIDNIPPFQISSMLIFPIFSDINLILFWSTLTKVPSVLNSWKTWIRTSMRHMAKCHLVHLDWSDAPIGHKYICAHLGYSRMAHSWELNSFLMYLFTRNRTFSFNRCSPKERNIKEKWAYLPFEFHFYITGDRLKLSSY